MHIQKDITTQKNFSEVWPCPVTPGLHGQEVRKHTCLVAPHIQGRPQVPQCVSYAHCAENTMQPAVSELSAKC